ncbi:DAK2 domain-containing protein [Streptomyces sp. NPDC051018]|uniref:DAK2 domain-containing protein n=1 Tax=Streptomyces sp. NPDC051018 TaxID=3365639 RepID=UPI0037A7D407
MENATGEARRVLMDALGRLSDCTDELGKLDAELGDGDLGITVSSGARAAIEAIAALPGEAGPAEMVKAAGKAFGGANPSTFAALIHGASISAAAVIRSEERLDPRTGEAMLRAATESIARRGKAELGDKTVLDPMTASLEALRTANAHGAEPLIPMIEAARLETERLTAHRSRKGRAAWVGERSAGRTDGGSVAYIRFLEFLRDAIAAR